MIKRLVCIFIILSLFAGHRTSNIFMNELAIDSGLNTPRLVAFNKDEEDDEDWDDLVDFLENGYDSEGGLTA